MNLTGTNSTAIGYNAMQNLAVGAGGPAIGQNALSGFPPENISVGTASLTANTTGTGMNKPHGEGLRYNEGKLRYDLLEPYAIEQLVKVFTAGSLKYDERNWERGMKWSSMLASLKRHLAAFEQGEDDDKESGLPHMAHVAWNALGLVTYSKYHPQHDDRPHKYLKQRKVGLDIDGVLADFIGHLMQVNGTPGHIPIHWNDPIVRDAFTKFKKDEQFWADLPPLLTRDDIPFEVHCYITARSVDPKITKAWLDRYLFPDAPVYCVGVGESKVEVAKSSGADIFIDDNYQNFIELNTAGVFTLLYDAPYNTKYNVGYKRVKGFVDFKQRFL